LCDDARDPVATALAVAKIIAAQPAGHWREVFAGQDACCTVVRSLEAALEDPQFTARGLFAAKLAYAGGVMRALPLPLAPALRQTADRKRAPALGEAGDLLKEG
jgi:crotonobetainyl-CoA:carnitine CoA-transferase CaiB-like acyl-CoA transferase